MKNKLFILLAFITLSNLCWSQEVLKTADYAEEVRGMSLFERKLAIDANALILNVACPIAKGAVITAATVNSTLGISYIANSIMDEENPDTLLGGFIGGFVESQIAALKLVTGKKQSSDPFKVTKESYATTAMAIKELFGPTSRCYKSVQKLGILLELTSVKGVAINEDEASKEAVNPITLEFSENRALSI